MNERKLIKELNNYHEQRVEVRGWIFRIRELKSIIFIVLRDRSGMVQCVLEKSKIDISELKLESVVSITGDIKKSNNKLNPFEIVVEKIEVLSCCKMEELPIIINKSELETNLDTMLNNRILSLRHEKIISIFKIQNLIVQGFRDFMIKEGFTEIFTPKIVSEGAEGGTEIFRLKYFDNDAYLAQSPQLYKQMMVASGVERVFEIAHVYRAEEHSTNRHLNEYVSMDLEVAFIDSEEDLMNLEEELLKFIFSSITSKGKEYLQILDAKIPQFEDKIPRISFSDALTILKNKYGRFDLEDDLDPESEKLICKYSEEKFGSEFIFLTNYPKKKRPMYTMPCGNGGTRSFDLLFRGVEITSGGQRIHEYNDLVKSMSEKGLDNSKFESYLSTFKYGMPPHGGFAIGLERITALLLGLKNVREASLFPRDRNRLMP